MASIAGLRVKAIEEVNLADWDVERENTYWRYNRDKARQE
jgi:hypothetical protein